MALTCFNDMVAVRGICESSANANAVYLDTLSIHREEIEQYFGKPYTNAEDFFIDMRTNAINELRTKINSAFMNKYITRTVVENTTVGAPSDNMDVDLGAAGKSRGIELVTTMYKSQLTLFVSRISLFTDYTGNVSVKVYDLQQNKLLDTITIACTANQISSSFVNKSYNIDRRNMSLAFIYETDSVNAYNTTISGTGCSSCSGNANYINSSAYANARGVEFTTADNKVSENATGLGNTAGMTLDYSVSCNHEAWLCGLVNTLAYPLALRTAINILNYGKEASQRLNSRTIIDQDKIEKRISLLEFTFGQSWDDIIRYMNVPEDPICFTCRQNTAYKMTVDK